MTFDNVKKTVFLFTALAVAGAWAFHIAGSDHSSDENSCSICAALHLSGKEGTADPAEILKKPEQQLLIIKSAERLTAARLTPRVVRNRAPPFSIS